MKKLLLAIAVIAFLMSGCARGRVESNKKLADSTASDSAK